MKLLLTAIITTLSLGAFAQTFNGVDQNGRSCSLKILKKSATSIKVKLKGKKLNKKITIQFSERDGEYTTDRSSDYGDFMGFEVGQHKFVKVNFEQRYFSYYQSAFLFSKNINITCDFE